MASTKDNISGHLFLDSRKVRLNFFHHFVPVMMLEHQPHQLSWEIAIFVSQEIHATNPTFYSADPLWDGDGCGPTSTCCSFNTPPWFHKQLSNLITDNVEMRVCRNEDAANEDVAIEIVEIYVQ